jgi:hypothetical protein
VAVSSLLNPSRIVRERPTTAAAAQNFITGGSPLGQGVVASAANKIVGFQRGAAGVAAKPPDLNSIIQTLSSNILTNVENRVQSVNKNVTQIVNQKTDGLEKKYQDRLDKIDAARPNSILQNFLNLYKEALGYIQFLGNRKNVKTLGDNLKALQNVFTETFNIAKIIRQTIVRIVKQLSNLPTANAGGGGLNLDIDIPGGNLRRSPLGGMSRLLRAGKPALMLGGAALAGGLGSKVVSGMMDIGGDVQAAPMTEGTIPGVLLDRFNSILDRFSAAINSLSNVKKSQPSPGGAAPVPAPQKPAGKPPGSGATPSSGGKVNAGDITANTPEEQAFIATVREAEGTSGTQGYNTFFGGSQYGGDLSTKTVTEVKKIQEKFLAEGRGNWSGGTSAAVGAGQFLYPEQIVSAMGMDPNKVKFTPELQNQMILYLAKKKRGIDVSKELTASDFKVLGQEWAGLSEYHGQGGTLGRTAKLYKENLKEARSGKEMVTTSTKPQKPPTVAAAQTQSTTQQQLAQTVSQPPTQQTPQVNIAPLNLSTPQAQSTKVGDTMAPPPVMSKGGVTVPFLSSSNHDNFLTLYSKMVYNIVDG